MKPTVGRIVHYVSYGTPGGRYASTCRAAVVTEVKGHAVSPNTLEEVPEWVVGLCVLNPSGTFFDRGIVQSEADHRGGTWHWPERTEEDA